MQCDLDMINRCCWIHKVKISESDYIDGMCWMGKEENDDEDYDANEYEDN